jgi:hypothetical protein
VAIEIVTLTSLHGLKKLIKQTQGKIAKTDKEIDVLVYKLYRITEKERKVIEGG